MRALEEIALAAYLPFYGANAVETGRATCLRAPSAPDSPMLNRIVGLDDGRPVEEAEVDAAFAAMGDTTFYVDVSPSADPHLDGLLERRGLERGLGWMLFERGPRAAPEVESRLAVAEVDSGTAGAWARIVSAAFGLPAEVLPDMERIPSLPGWTAFLAVDGAEPAAAAAVWTQPPAAYFGFAGTLPAYRGQGGQGALFAARIERALELGCGTLVTETGEQQGEGPGPSYRNILRFGFVERFVVGHRLRRRHSATA